MSSRIASIGLAAPEGVLEQADAAQLAIGLTGAGDRRARAIHALHARSGVDRRGVAIVDAAGQQTFYPPGDAGTVPSTGERMRRYAELAPGLAERASREAIERAGIAAASITHLVTASCTGFSAPGVDLTLMDRLGLAPDAQRTHVGFMGCHAAINALRVADAIAGAHEDAIVLVCCVEVCSLHLQHTDHEGAAVANALFADGAGACVVGPDRAFPDAPRVRSSAARVFPGSRDAMTWSIGEAGFVMTLSPRLPGLLAEVVPPWLDAWLASEGLDREAVGAWAIHPGGPRVVASIADAMGLDAERCVASDEVLATMGNMSSPTILFVLRRLLERDAPRPIAAMAFGPGLAGEAMLIG